MLPCAAIGLALGGNERDTIIEALTRFYLHGHSHWLKPLDGRVPEPFVRVAMSHHIQSVKPWEWTDVPPFWQEWTLIHMAVVNEVANGPPKRS